MKKVIVSLMLLLAFMVNSVSTVNAAEVLKVNDGEDVEVELTVEELSDGVTVIMQRNENGKLVCTPYVGDVASVPMPMSTSDGVLEVAVFHLGLTNWTGSTGDLYFSISADELMSKVTGTAYVKSTSLLFSETFYESSFNEYLYSLGVGSRTLQEDINLGSETKVKVGFKNVVLSCVNGSTGSFANNSLVVYK